MEIDEFPVIIERSAKEFSIREQKTSKELQIKIKKDTFFQKDNFFQITTDCFNVKRKRLLMEITKNCLNAKKTKDSFNET